ncbi:hypothetical protein D3C81_1511560 [compost metagenome]
MRSMNYATASNYQQVIILVHHLFDEILIEYSTLKVGFCNQIYGKILPKKILHPNTERIVTDIVIQTVGMQYSHNTPYNSISIMSGENTGIPWTLFTSDLST